MSETTTRRIRRERDEWQRLIDEQAVSGLTQSAFCRANGLSLASFYNWKRRLTVVETPSPSWVELGTLEQSATTRWDIELDLGDGLCLRLRRC